MSDKMMSDKMMHGTDANSAAGEISEAQVGALSQNILQTLSPIEDEDRVEECLQMCAQLWEMDTKTFLKHIPCPQPKSLMRKNLPHIHSKRHSFFVGAKTNGVRLFLLFSFHTMPDTGNEVEYAVFMDRKGNFYQSSILSHTNEMYDGSLFDGEMCADGTYVLFDVIAASGYSMHAQPFATRLKKLKQLYVTLFSTCIQLKQWRALHEAQSVYEQGGQHCDGLIIVSGEEMLTPGTLPQTFKWKLPEHHTIDFHVKRDPKLHHLLVLWLGVTREVPASNIRIMPCHDFERLCGMHANETECVIECSMQSDGDKKRWMAIPIQKRYDKRKGNSMRVAKLTLSTINDRVMLEEL